MTPDTYVLYHHKSSTGLNSLLLSCMVHGLKSIFRTYRRLSVLYNMHRTRQTRQRVSNYHESKDGHRRGVKLQLKMSQEGVSRFESHTNDDPLNSLQSWWCPSFEIISNFWKYCITISSKNSRQSSCFGSDWYFILYRIPDIPYNQWNCCRLNSKILFLPRTISHTPTITPSPRLFISW